MAFSVSHTELVTAGATCIAQQLAKATARVRQQVDEYLIDLHKSLLSGKETRSIFEIIISRPQEETHTVFLQALINVEVELLEAGFKAKQKRVDDYDDGINHSSYGYDYIEIKL